MGNWIVLGLDTDGRVSGPSAISVDTFEPLQRTLDFEPTAVAAGRVIDAYTGTGVADVEVQVAALDTYSTEGILGDRPGRFAYVITDHQGYYLTSFPAARSATMDAAHPGYQALRWHIEIENDVAREVRTVSLIPADGLEVRLRGVPDGNATTYSVQGKDDDPPVAFDELGRARVRVDAQDVRPSVYVRAPNGVATLVIANGRAADVTPLIVDVSGPARLEVVLDKQALEAQPAMIQVSIAGVGGAWLEWCGMVVTGRTVIEGLPEGEAMVSLVDLAKNDMIWEQARKATLRGGATTSMRFDASLRPVRTIVRGAAGKPIAGFMLGARGAGDNSGWEPSVVTDDEGVCYLPRCEESRLLLVGYDRDGVSLVDHELLVDLASMTELTLDLGEIVGFEAVLHEQGRPRPYGAVDFVGAVSGVRVQLRKFDEAGSTGVVQFFDTSQVAVQLADPGLMEYRMIYPLRPSRNIIDVNSTGAFEFHCVPEVEAEGLDVEPSDANEDWHQWMQQGRVQRQVFVLNPSTQVIRYAPVPLGSYTWTRDGNLMGQFTLRHAGAVTVIHVAR